MSARRTIDTRIAVAGVTIASLAAVVFFLVLTLLARPHGLQAGRAEATRQIDAIEARLQSPGDPYAYPVHALCRDRPEVAAAALKDRLGALAGAGVKLTGVTTTLGVADETAGGIAPVALQFEADGPYDAVIDVLDGLARSRPEVFVDTVDLKSEVSSAALKFSGRIYCSPSVPL